MPAKKTTWTGSRIREQFLTYFEKNGHKIMASSSLVPHNDPTVFLTTAGMQQMVPFFLGEEVPPSIRMTTSQKCFRTVDIESVGDARHLTFFEMLGNFSVGDYFKEGAITFAWELLTKVYGLNPDRLYPTVYPADDAAVDLWKRITGISEDRITRLEDNWWDRGPTTPGPCGPDSEIYYDLGVELGCGKSTCAPGCDCERYLEIWNLVFMQYNQDGKGNKEPLKKQNIDTGMGLERLSMILQNKSTVFETDLFFPIIKKFAQIAGTTYGKNELTDRSLRVIADHGRALVFLAGDGVLPSNEGRGYIFRRILRRAVRHGKLLGLDKPFLADAADTVIDLLGTQYPELHECRERIIDVLTIEERKFGQTLTTGLQLLESILEELRQSSQTFLPGDKAFTLYDTHGFPFELTVEVANERGISVDEEGFRQAMKLQRERSRQLGKIGLARDNEIWQQLIAGTPAATFTGYEAIRGKAHITAMIAEGALQEMIVAPQIAITDDLQESPMALVLDVTPFYAESGGQIGDKGVIMCATGTFEVHDTQRPVAGYIVHYGRVVEGYFKQGDTVDAIVDEERRNDTRKNHSATHLLHRALKNLLGESVVQHGSLVEPDRLRFDFNFQRNLSDEEIAKIDQSVNAWIRDNFPVSTNLTELEKARRSGAMALFGEKYPDPVRVVSMGSSMELCGGTHVRATGDIGVYVTVQETSSSAGIRRIEALTGRAAEEYLMNRKRVVDLLSSKLQVAPDQIDQRVEQLANELAALRKEVQRYQREAFKADADELAAKAVQAKGIAVISAVVKAPSVDVMREMGDHIRAKAGTSVVALAAVAENGIITFIVMATPDAVKLGVHAGKIAQEIGGHIGGKGGGRPDSAQGGGKSTADLPTAMERVRNIVVEQVK